MFQLIGKGVSRTVLGTKNYAIKFPGSYYKGHGYGYFIRGWLANQSEWKQRKREDVCRPVFTFFHFFLVMPRADTDGYKLFGDIHIEIVNKRFYAFIIPSYLSTHTDELKASSWGRFGEDWLLLDYDRCYSTPRQGLFNRFYWWYEERKFSRFP